MTDRARPRQLGAIGAVVAVVAGAVGYGAPAMSVAQPAATTAGPRSVADRQAAAAGRSVTDSIAEITLITGDVVSVGSGPHGAYTAELTEPADRPTGQAAPASVVREGESVYVYPAGALPLVTAGVLDRRLFDVAYLVENGYANGATSSVPLIVEYAGSDPSAGTLRRRADALPASTDVAPLASIDGAAVQIAKRRAETFWTSIVETDRPAVGTEPTLGRGLSKVWLDGMAHASLDESVPLIGAPEAWAEGYDGSGTRIAVLDTGVDAAHPDLADRIEASESFVPGQAVQDGNGHGTHVASTIAGSGAASDGSYRGVAPGARLLVGKVLNDAGSGSDSQVIAGMQWAVDQGADIVSMSLGDCCTDGTDPLSQAVDELSATSDTLFVVAAGNNGTSGPGTINTPGTADAALTVAAVDNEDELAGFSSRGPRLGDYGLKPDIAAPGVDITAARADGTQLGPIVGEKYTTISGTSMATPHVAGAAAILIQRHPAWSPQRIKDALMSTSKDDGYDVYEQGAGRVDVARAVEQQVTATGSVDFGVVPYARSEPVTRTITYSNDTTAPVTLHLSAELESHRGTAPTDALRFDRETVEVPAGGTADVTATFDPADGPQTWYSGAVRASADGVQLTTAVGGFRELEQTRLTGRIIAPDGATDLAYGGWVFLMTDDRDEVAAIGTSEDGAETSGVVNAGHYAVRTFVRWRDAAGRPNSALVVAPGVDATEDVEVTFDLRDAERLTTSLWRPTEPYVQQYGFVNTAEGGRASVRTEYRAYGANRLWALPTGAAPSLGELYAYNQRIYTERRLSVRLDGGPALDARYPVPNTIVQDIDITRFDGRHVLPVVDVGRGIEADFDGVDVRGKLALLDVSDLCGLTCTGYAKDRVERAVAAGAVGVIGYGSAGQGFLDPDPYATHRVWPDYPIPTVSVPADQGRLLRELVADGPVRVVVDGQANPDQLYPLTYPWLGSIPSDVSDRLGPRELYRVDNPIHGDEPGEATLNWNAQLPLRGSDDPMRQVDPVRRIGQSNSLQVRAPTTVTTHYGPLQPDVGWSHGASMVYDVPDDVDDANINAWSDSRYDEFTRPGRRTDELGEHPLVPNTTVYTPETDKYFVPTCLSCRNGDMFNPVHVLSSDGSGGGYQAYDLASPYDAEGQTEFHLYRDGAEVPVQDGLVWIAPPWFVYRNAYFTLPATPDDYRLTEHWESGYTMQRYARVVDTEWRFESARPTTGFTSPDDGANCMGWYISLAHETCQPTGELFVGYDLGLRLDNTLPAGERARVTVSAFHSPFVADPPRVRSLELWMSTGDSGWRQVRTVPTGGGTYTAWLPNPRRGADAASLRVRAVDADGNSVEQTIQSAYGIR